MAEIKTERLCHVYSVGTPFEKAAIEGIDLTLPQGQLIGVIGHTGSGKSTFIQHLNALLQPTSGAVLCGGEDINKDKFTRKAIRFKVGLVFQYPEYQLFEETVYKDIAFGPTNMKLSEEEIDSRVREAAGFTGIDEELFERSPLELSGGQKRRIAIAGVIAMRPRGSTPPAAGRYRKTSAPTGKRPARRSSSSATAWTMLRALPSAYLSLTRGTSSWTVRPRRFFQDPRSLPASALTCRMRRSLQWRCAAAASRCRRAYIRMSSCLPPPLI